ncbi:zonadhesin [Aphomia sociella]
MATNYAFSKCVKRNEVLACVKDCPPERTCRNKGIRFSCVVDDKPCKQKCVCKEGFYRNINGECVTGEQCDMCPGEHEYYACGVACDNVCSQLHEQNKTNCPIVNIKCNEKCYCEDGYARDDNGICIPIENCRPTCGANEVYSICKKSCPPETCLSLVAKFRCNANELCKPRCTCKPGYLRLKTGAPCMPIRQCPPRRTSNAEHRSLPVIASVKNKCSEQPASSESLRSFLDHRSILLVNVLRCVCRYAVSTRGSICPTGRKSGRHYRTIPVERTCGANEVYSECKRGCPPETCISIVAKFKCDSNEVCRPRCTCKPGFLRLKTGAPCMPTRQCPELANSPDFN